MYFGQKSIALDEFDIFCRTNRAESVKIGCLLLSGFIFYKNSFKEYLKILIITTIIEM